MKKTTKKLVSLLTAASLLVSMFATTAFASLVTIDASYKAGELTNTTDDVVVFTNVPAGTTKIVIAEGEKATDVPTDADAGFVGAKDIIVSNTTEEVSVAPLDAEKVYTAYFVATDTTTVTFNILKATYVPDIHAVKVENIDTENVTKQQYIVLENKASGSIMAMDEVDTVADTQTIPLSKDLVEGEYKIMIISDGIAKECVIAITPSIVASYDSANRVVDLKNIPEEATEANIIIHKYVGGPEGSPVFMEEFDTSATERKLPVNPLAIGKYIVTAVLTINGEIEILTTYFDVTAGQIPTPTVAPTATAAPTPTATVAPTPTATAAPTPTATVAPTPTATVAPTVAPTPTATVAPTVAPTPTATVAPTAAPTPTATVAPTAAPTPTATVAPTAAPTPTATVAPTPTATVAPTATATAAPTVRPLPTPTPDAGGSGGGGSTGGWGGGSGGGSSRPNGNAGRPSGGAIITPTTPEPVEKHKFMDMGAYAWADDAVSFLVKLGIINGRTDTIFDPSASVTRAEFVKMVCSAMGLPERPNRVQEFDDVTKSHWAYGWIAIASELGIVDGVEDGKFAPNAAINREQMATILYRAIVAAKNAGLLPEGQAISFADNGTISSYAQEAVNALSAAGVINGVTDTTFAPKATANRAQAAAIIYQYLNAVGIAK